MRVREVEGKRGWAVALAVSIIKPTLLTFTSHTWVDGEKIPATGGCIVVVNHISHVDPFFSAHFVYDHGRVPRYLAKSGLFRNRLLGRLLSAAGQIPVERLTRNAIGAYDAAVAAVRAGECVVVYPEGTLTRDPALWPMRGKSGAARIALATGCPVIPVAQWGPQDVLPPYTVRPRLLPRKHVEVKAGDPVELGDLAARQPTAEVITEATERIMAALTDLVADLRRETPPLERFDSRRLGLKETGNPAKDARRARRRNSR